MHAYGILDGRSAFGAQDLTAYQQAHKLRGMPNLLEYLSYVFASGNLLAGEGYSIMLAVCLVLDGHVHRAHHWALRAWATSKSGS